MFWLPLASSQPASVAFLPVSLASSPPSAVMVSIMTVLIESIHDDGDSRTIVCLSVCFR